MTPIFLLQLPMEDNPTRLATMVAGEPVYTLEDAGTGVVGPRLKMGGPE